MKNEIIHDLPFADYAAIDAVNNSLLSEVFESPGRVPWRKANPKEATDAMIRGGAIDSLALTPDVYKYEHISPPRRMEELPPHFVEVPAEYLGKNGAWLKAGKDWRAEQEAAGRVCVKPGDWNGYGLRSTTGSYKAWREHVESRGRRVLTHSEETIIRGAAESVLAYDVARALIDEGEAQISITWQDADTGLWCKGRPDLYIPEASVELCSALRGWMNIAPIAGDPILIDLKSTGQTVGPDSVASLCFNFGWHRQLAYYLDGLSVITGRVHIDAMIIAVEQQPPHRCEVYDAPYSIIEQGRDEYHAALEMYAQCDADDDWPLNSGAIHKIQFKPWMTR